MSRKTLVTVVALSIAFAAQAEAQLGGIGRRIKKTVEEKVSTRIEERANAAADTALNRGENVIRCVLTDRACIQRAQASGATVVVTDQAGQPVSEAQSQQAIADATGGASPVGAGAWVNYDFVPGERVIFAEDYSQDRVGNFPRRLVFVKGNAEVAEWEGGRYLRTADGVEFAIELPEILPERFTMEMDVYHGNRSRVDSDVTIRFAPLTAGTQGEIEYASEPRNTQFVQVGWTEGGVKGGGIEAVQSLGQSGYNHPFWKKIVPIRILADGQYVKVYMGQHRVANIPNANLGRSNKIRIRVPAAADDTPALVGPIRIAASGKELYDALSETGRVATQGILFDTGSDVIRPESTPTLKEIGAMLTEHPELRLRIEGHTDNVGSAEANLALSQRRADAVKRHLTTTDAALAARIETAGLGDTKPAAPNTTSEGRQTNRRVELVRL